MQHQSCPVILMDTNLHFYQTRSDISHITETEIKVKRVQHVYHCCTVNDYLNGRLCLKPITVGLLAPYRSLLTMPNYIGNRKRNMERSRYMVDQFKTFM